MMNISITSSTSSTRNTTDSASSDTKGPSPFRSKKSHKNGDSSSIEEKKNKTNTITEEVATATGTTTTNTTTTRVDNNKGLTNIKPSKKSNPLIVWISNVAQNTSANELSNALSTCGRVVGAKILVDSRFPGSNCFGYVSMSSVDDVACVVAKFNNTELNGQMIKVEKYDNRKNEFRNRAENYKEASERNNVSANNNNKMNGGGSRGKSRSRENDSSRKRRRSSSTDSRGCRASSEGRDERRRRLAETRARDSRKRSPSRQRGILTFSLIKEERERQKQRDRERSLRSKGRLREEEFSRIKEVERRHRREAMRLNQENKKLEIEQVRMKLERERQLLEHEKIHLEKIELEKALMELKENTKQLERSAATNRYYDNNHHHQRTSLSVNDRRSPPRSVSKDHYTRRSYSNSRIQRNNRGRSPIARDGSRFSDRRDNSRFRPSPTPPPRGVRAKYPERIRRDHRSPPPNFRNTTLPLSASSSVVVDHQQSRINYTPNDLRFELNNRYNNGGGSSSTSTTSAAPALRFPSSSHHVSSNNNNNNNNWRPQIRQTFPGVPGPSTSSSNNNNNNWRPPIRPPFGPPHHHQNSVNWRPTTIRGGYPPQNSTTTNNNNNNNWRPPPSATVTSNSFRQIPELENNNSIRNRPYIPINSGINVDPSQSAAAASNNMNYENILMSKGAAKY